MSDYFDLKHKPLKRSRMSLSGKFNPAENTPTAIPPYKRPAGKPAAETLPLDVYDTAELHGFEPVLEEAFFILAQSKTATRLADAATNGGYVIVMMQDDPNTNLRGYVDHEQQLIFLAREKDPRALALTLGHELTHVSQKTNGGIDIDVRMDAPLHAIKKLLAMEADARAHEMLIATELSFPAENGTGVKISFPEIIDIAAQKSENPLVAALLKHARPQIEAGTLAANKLLAACFKSFYGEAGFRATYEKVITDKLCTYSREDFQNPAHFQREIAADDLIQKIDAHSICYLDKNKQHVDLESPVYQAISPRTRDILSQLQNIRRENPACAAERTWDAPLYLDIANKLAPQTKPKAPGT